MGAVIKDGAGRLLLIKRGHEPEAGRWSLPGGRIEPGESDEQALVREIGEETGLTVTVGRLRPCPVLDYKFVALGHNTIRGAAGAAVLNAELMHREGWL